jgi:hypothetical protein
VTPRVKQRTRAPSRRTHQPVAIMLDFVDPKRAGRRGRVTFDGWQGSMKPERRCKIMG